MPISDTASPYEEPVKEERVTIQSTSSAGSGALKRKTFAANQPRVTEIIFQDIDNDGVKDWVLKIKTTDLQLKAGQTATDFYITNYWYTYEAMTLNAPADLSTIGTTPATPKTIQWQTTFTNTKRAHLIYNAQLKFNTTAYTKWDSVQSYLSIPGKANIPISDFVRTTDGTNTYYDLVLGTTLQNAQIIALGANDVNRFSWDLKLVLSLASGDKITVKLTLTPLKATGTADTDVTDTAQLNA